MVTLAFDDILLNHGFSPLLETIEPSNEDKVKRSEPSFVQTVFQYSPPKRKCRNTQSLAVASGSNALSYMSFVAAVITLVLNINNNINANNNNLNRINLNFGANKNTVTNLNQNVGNNFNLMFPPGKKRRKKRKRSVKNFDDLLIELSKLHRKIDSY